jgi:hypothetical protein
MMTVGGGDNKAKKERTSSHGAGERRGSFQGMFERGKEMLGLGKPRASGERERKVEKREETAVVE